ncbi:MAG: hypothetical protein WCD86_10085 [Ktedonobacteraceae bacterium]
MRIRASTDQQVVLLGINQVGFNQFWRMGGIVDLNTVEWDFSANLIEQMRGIKRKFILVWSADQRPSLYVVCICRSKDMSGVIENGTACLIFLLLFLFLDEPVGLFKDFPIDRPTSALIDDQIISRHPSPVMWQRTVRLRTPKQEKNIDK